MALHKFSFAMYSLHYLACFWEYEDYLWRHHPESHIASFLLQDLHSQRENGFSTMITIAIIHHLPKYATKNENDAFRSKYFYIAYITKMTAHQGVELFESHYRSGHSLGTNQERYLDQDILALTSPDAY